MFLGCQDLAGRLTSAGGLGPWVRIPPPTCPECRDCQARGDGTFHPREGDDEVCGADPPGDVRETLDGLRPQPKSERPHPGHAKFLEFAMSSCGLSALLPASGGGMYLPTPSPAQSGKGLFPPLDRQSHEGRTGNTLVTAGSPSLPSTGWTCRKHSVKR